MKRDEMKTKIKSNKNQNGIGANESGKQTNKWENIANNNKSITHKSSRTKLIKLSPMCCEFISSLEREKEESNILESPTWWIQSLLQTIWSIRSNRLGDLVIETKCRNSG